MDALARLFRNATKSVRNKTKRSLANLSEHMEGKADQQNVLTKELHRNDPHHFMDLTQFFSKVLSTVQGKAIKSIEYSTQQLSKKPTIEQVAPPPIATSPPSPKQQIKDRPHHPAWQGLSKFWQGFGGAIAKRQEQISKQVLTKLQKDGEQIPEQLMVEEEQTKFFFTEQQAPAEVVLEQIVEEQEAKVQETGKVNMGEGQPIAQITDESLKVQPESQVKLEDKIPREEISKLENFLSNFSKIIKDKSKTNFDLLKEKINEMPVANQQILSSFNQENPSSLPLQSPAKETEQITNQNLEQSKQQIPIKALDLRIIEDFPYIEHLKTQPVHAQTMIPSRASRKSHRRHVSQLKNIPSKGYGELLNQFQYNGQSDHQLESYVEEERIAQIKQRVEKLKKQHLYTAGDDPENEQEDPQKIHRPNILSTKVYKHKTESSRYPYRLFQPKICVNEAPQTHRKVSSSLRVLGQEENWPATSPKKRRGAKKSLGKSQFASPDHSKSPKIGKHSIKMQNQSPILPEFYDKLARLKQAKKKKLVLQHKLEQINKQIKEIRTVEKTSLDRVKSPKNSIKQMISISDDRDARIKALSLVRRLKKDRDKRQRVVTNIFSQVDQQIIDNIKQLTILRAEHQRKQKQKKKLQVLERMRDQERRKFEEYRLQSANLQFLNALKGMDTKKQHNDRRSLAWIKTTDLPELAVRKDILERLRNLSYIQKRSLIEDYNRELIKKS